MNKPAKKTPAKKVATKKTPGKRALSPQEAWPCGAEDIEKDRDELRFIISVDFYEDEPRPNEAKSFLRYAKQFGAGATVEAAYMLKNGVKVKDLM